MAVSIADVCMREGNYTIGDWALLQKSAGKAAGPMVVERIPENAIN